MANIYFIIGKVWQTLFKYWQSVAKIEILVKCGKQFFEIMAMCGKQFIQILAICGKQFIQILSKCGKQFIEILAKVWQKLILVIKCGKQLIQSKNQTNFPRLLWNFLLVTQA